MANTPIRFFKQQRKTSREFPITEIILNSTWDKPAIVADAADRDTKKDDYTYSDAMAFAVLKTKLNEALSNIDAPFRCEDL